MVLYFLGDLSKIAYKIKAWRKLLPSKWKQNTLRTAKFFSIHCWVCQNLQRLGAWQALKKWCLWDSRWMPLMLGLLVTEWPWHVWASTSKKILHLIKHWSPLMPAGTWPNGWKRHAPQSGWSGAMLSDEGLLKKLVVAGCQLAGGQLWVGVDDCQLAGGHFWVVVDGCQLAGGHL